MADHIAFYGKGGVGTSTLVSNISAALVEAGFRILQIGCGDNGDSCITLNGGVSQPSVSEMYDRGLPITFDSAVIRGFKGIFCVELGCSKDPQGDSNSPRALDLLNSQSLISSLNPDFVLYDISGDKGRGFLNVLADRVALHRIFAVTTADFMALTAVNAVLVRLESHAESRVPVPIGGLIPNGISSSFEESFISDFALKSNIHTLGRVPRSQMVRQCELYGKTVIEAAPLSNQSYFYRRLANQIADEAHKLSFNHQPSPLTSEQLRAWACEWADRLFALENGLVTDGAAI